MARPETTQYEEELIKLRNDNFSLKLRIHLLEERQGLALRPGDSDAAKENVFRVNLDLRYKVFNLALFYCTCPWNQAVCNCTVSP